MAGSFGMTYEAGEDLIFKLSLPLSYIYHSETKFKKGIPLLSLLYQQKDKLNAFHFSLQLHWKQRHLARQHQQLQKVLGLLSNISAHS